MKWFTWMDKPQTTSGKKQELARALIYAEYRLKEEALFQDYNAKLQALERERDAKLMRNW